MAGLKITGVDLKREIIQVENDGEVAVSLEGIKLVDKDSKNTFAFPKGAELNAKEKLTLYCAAGKQQEDELDKLEAQEKEVGGNVFLWRTKEGNPRKQGILNDTGETVTLMDAEDKVLDTFDAPKGTVIDDNATAVETDYSTEDSTEDSTEANNEKSGNDEKDKAEEDSKKVADEKSSDEDEEEKNEKIEKIKDSNNDTNDGENQAKTDPGFLGWCCSTRNGNS